MFASSPKLLFESVAMVQLCFSFFFFPLTFCLSSPGVRRCAPAPCARGQSCDGCSRSTQLHTELHPGGRAAPRGVHLLPHQLLGLALGHSVPLVCSQLEAESVPASLGWGSQQSRVMQLCSFALQGCPGRRGLAGPKGDKVSIWENT